MTDKNNILRIDHDDQLDEVVNKANRCLKHVGVSFIDDEDVHDGFCLYELREIDVSSRPQVIADRLLRHSSEFLVPLGSRMSVLPGQTLSVSCDPLSDMPPFDAVRLSLTVAPEAPAPENLVGLWINLTIDGQDIRHPTEWTELSFVPGPRCGIALQAKHHGSATVCFYGVLRCRRTRASVEAEIPTATAQEVADTLEVSRHLRHIADELDQARGSLCACIEDQRTSKQDDRQTIVRVTALQERLLPKAALVSLSLLHVAPGQQG
jgi:hypothetical protein